jgi:hypothetical protein
MQNHKKAFGKISVFKIGEPTTLYVLFDIIPSNDSYEISGLSF